MCCGPYGTVYYSDDFTTLSIIKIILSQYNNYHDSTKINELPLLTATIPHPNKSNSNFKNSYVTCIMKFWYVNYNSYFSELYIQEQQ